MKGPSSVTRIGSPVAGLFVLLLSAAGWSAEIRAQSLQYLGQQVLPHATIAFGTRVGGLSGLDYDAASNRFFAISDDRSRHHPARFYTLSIDIGRFNKDPSPGYDGIRFDTVRSLARGDGTPYAADEEDPESIRLGPFAGTLWWASEGNIRAGHPPAIIEANSDGRERRRLVLPPYLSISADAGPRDNLAFESLTIAAETGRLFTALENGLKQDGPPASTAEGSPCRLLEFDEQAGTQVAEYVYLTDPVPSQPGTGAARPGDNGLVELLAGHDVMLALERSYIPGDGNGIRIYRIDFSSATDVIGIPALAGREYRPVGKTLLLDLNTLNIPLDNVEGMSWGPTSLNGHATLILVSDDNFSPRQATRFIGFELTP